MPKVQVIFFKEDDEVPVLAWLRDMGKRDKRVLAKCWQRIESLAENGHALRRPAADTLRDGIHELRIGFGTVNYRILYFFHGSAAAILAHAVTKEARLPQKDIDTAVTRKRQFEGDPDKYTHTRPDQREVPK